jgi:ABC-2 type transport system permease protein
MNWEHFKAFIWLRWRTRVNLFRKGGELNAVLFWVVCAIGISSIVSCFATGVGVGYYLLPRLEMSARLFLWDGLVIVFLFSWLVGLMTDLQRSESLSLEKVLHLPVSLREGFLINYFCSWFSLSLATIGSAMLGIAVGQVLGLGVVMLFGIPLLIAFLLAVTAVTYQFKGWLASLMTNPKRRRTVIFIVTISFVLLFQIPNIWNMSRIAKDTQLDGFQAYVNDQAKLNQELQDKKITIEEHTKGYEDLKVAYEEKKVAESQASKESTVHLAIWINRILPIGWLPLGVARLSEYRFLAPLIGCAGLLGIAALSLMRSYRTTVRIYTGQTSSQDEQTKQEVIETPSNKPKLLEWQLPLINEQATAVALGNLRSLMRAPETKMALIMPLVILLIQGGMLYPLMKSPPDVIYRPFMACGIVVFLTIFFIQLIGNQFGYDRGGFRAYVLSPVPRRDVLLGKNLSFAPLMIGVTWIAVTLLQILMPMRWDHYFAILLLSVSVFAIFCLIANQLSILVPLPMSAGSMRAAQVRLAPMLAYFFSTFLIPVFMMPIAIPFGLEWLLRDRIGSFPLAFTLSLVVAAAGIAIYLRLLHWQGNQLQAKETNVLQIVTSKE